MRRVAEFIHNIHAPTWLGILVAVVIILRIPSFFEPYYYGDEMIYLTLGQGIRQGITLYSHLHDNKPPLIYLLAALSGNLFWFKAILAAFNVASIILFWKLALTLFPKRDRLQRISTIVFGLATTLPLLEGNTVNAELLMVAPTLAAFWLLFAKKLNFRNLFFAGTLFSLAALFKIPAAFEFPVILVFWLIAGKFDFKKTIYLTLGFTIPIGLSFLWYFLKGAHDEYLVAAFLQNVGYLSSFRPGDTVEPFFVRNLPLIIRAGVVALGILILFLSRAKLSKQFIFLSIWILFSLFAVTLSERPYPHYLIQAVPAVSFFFGILIADKTIQQSLTVLPLALFFFVSIFYNFWFYQSGSYYGRFIQFLSQRIAKEEYFSKFEKQVQTNYKTAEILTASTRPGEPVFVWGPDSPTIYALSRRLPPIKYVAEYHVFDYASPSLILTEVEAKMPKFIVILPNAKPFPALRKLVQKEYLLIDNEGGAEIWLK